ncbi:MAG TPA: hypothetical protein DCM07_20075 [Planctomycetaceae bacterium]|nr:hypothetical protein [Planctomycetaceae bacterium]
MTEWRDDRIFRKLTLRKGIHPTSRDRLTKHQPDEETMDLRHHYLFEFHYDRPGNRLVVGFA